MNTLDRLNVKVKYEGKPQTTYSLKVSDLGYMWQQGQFRETIKAIVNDTKHRVGIEKIVIRTDRKSYRNLKKASTDLKEKNTPEFSYWKNKMPPAAKIIDKGALFVSGILGLGVGLHYGSETFGPIMSAANSITDSIEFISATCAVVASAVLTSATSALVGKIAVSPLVLPLYYGREISKSKMKALLEVNKAIKEMYKRKK